MCIVLSEIVRFVLNREKKVAFVVYCEKEKRLAIVTSKIGPIK